MYITKIYEYKTLFNKQPKYLHHDILVFIIDEASKLKKNTTFSLLIMFMNHW